MTPKIENIINILKTLTLLEAAELVTQIEEIFGVDTNINHFPLNLGNIGSLPGHATNTANENKEEEKVNFDIILSEVPTDKKIGILKVVRSITGLGLKESKDIVDNVPKIIKESLSKEEAENIKKELESAGAKVIVK
jgi:large subunit ribosomal protein L7/L12